MDRYYKKRFVPLALPALILFVMVIVIPFIMGVIYSFTAWRGTYFAGGDHFWEAFVGFDNYVKAFKTKKFLDAFVYTIKVTLVAVVAINVVSLAMALLATSLNKGAAAYRTIYFLSLIHISEPTRLGMISYAVFCLKKKNKKKKKKKKKKKIRTKYDIIKVEKRRHSK